MNSEKIEYIAGIIAEDTHITIPILIWYANDEYCEDEVFFWDTTQWSTQIPKIEFENPQTQKYYDLLVDYIQSVDLTELLGELEPNNMGQTKVLDSIVYLSREN